MTECKNGIQSVSDVSFDSQDKVGCKSRSQSERVNGELTKSKYSEDSGYACNGNHKSDGREDDLDVTETSDGTPDSEEQNFPDDDVFMHSDDLNSESNEDDIPVGCDADCNGAMAMALPGNALSPSGGGPVSAIVQGICTEDNDTLSTFALNSACRVFDFLDESTEADAMHLTVNRSMSECSEGSWSSAFSTESHQDEVTLQCKDFMEKFVNLIFSDSGAITQTEKAKFGQLCQYSAGRLWFARYVNAQRVNSQRVTEQTFYRLVQFFAVCLFECDQADDFVPAKSLMNMCFTFYHEHEGFPRNESKTTRGYLYSFLKDQPIWQSIRFWNAAFFDAVHCEREQRSPVHRENWRHMSSSEREDTQQLDENITFGQLGTFTNNMMAFGLSKDLCIAFLDKQSTIGNLSEEQRQLLKENIQQLDIMRTKSPLPSPRIKFLAGLKTKFSKPPKTKSKSE
ncbi:uncharacterized protein KIAA0513-like isoform X2 [Ptychodera flava]|uniref:uncharacterized protein KIAA0513-like isoform X2 n=1 Tax=Ptychodera flava TaxID=63121 RepID=UPI00396A98CF